ncbi:MAG: ATPase [Calditrichales bacterium]|nr:MAG: ATPase [Calditrichales bacterium]
MQKSSYGRNDRLIKEKRHDAYFNASKLSEHTVCIECGALFSNGRWTWKSHPVEVTNSHCPACKRCADNYPAGRIALSGEFFRDHKDEIINFIQNVGNQEKNERPLERIMNIRSERQSARVTTTGIHIARRIGEALSRAYKGDYSFKYLDEDDQIRVTWHR